MQNTNNILITEAYDSNRKVTNQSMRVNARDNTLLEVPKFSDRKNNNLLI